MPAWQKRLVILSCFIAIAVLVLCYIFLPDYVYSSGANMRSTDFPKKVGVIELYPIVAVVPFFMEIACRNSKRVGTVMLTYTLLFIFIFAAFLLVGWLR